MREEGRAIGEREGQSASGGARASPMHGMMITGRSSFDLETTKFGISSILASF